ncbi:MAG: hypothetical protein JMN26_18295 [gamma proteobacterium endosymbiont of Lamellibrachia anaximandri]|nr:hypothetical protein [gamma proteobacterium endosymbiont of Lamellibrachia anaximandri]
MYIYTNVFASKELIEFTTMIANFAIIWLLLHEIGHIQLGHIDGIKNKSSYNEVNALSDDEESFWLRLCQEFAADTYASNRFYSTFFRQDAVGILPRNINDKDAVISFLMQAAIIPPLILHRAQFSTLARANTEAGAYPDARVRLFNALATIIPAIDNNNRIFSPLYKAAGYQYNTFETSQEHLFIPYMMAIWLCDVFLQCICSKPFFPWKIKPSRLICKDGVQNRIQYGFVDHKLTVDIEKEIIAAALNSCYGYANFKADPTLEEMHSNWREIISKCYTTWQDEIINNRCSQLEFAKKLFTEPLFDPYRTTTLDYFYEVTNSHKNYDDDRKETAYKHTISRIEKLIKNIKQS